MVKPLSERLNIRLLLAALLPLLVGALSSFFSNAGMMMYQQMPKPPLSPPAIVFPIAWTILYLLMGIASYYIWEKEAPADTKQWAIFLYLFQLAMNFSWSIIFFTFHLYLFAFIWLIGMYIVVIVCTVYFFQINAKAGWLMIPYNIWLAFAAYLNLATVIITW